MVANTSTSALTWIVDSGATSHMTNSYGNLQNPEAYTEPEQDLSSGRTLFKGPVSEGFYPFHPSSSHAVHPKALTATVKASNNVWHQRSQQPHSLSTELQVFSPPNPPLPPLLPSSNHHHMQTRSKSGIFKTRALTVTKHPLSAHVSSDYTPHTYLQTSKHPHWHKAMQEEYNALLSTGTWSLVPSISSENIVGCKWVFRIKRKPDGSIDRYKARLVAKGYNQQEGLDYSETFSPMAKPVTIRTLLTLACQFDWFLNQLDVSNAFLHGALQYLTWTRPDLSFAVNLVCQYMHSPRVSHLQAIKRILWYLKGTIDMGLWFSKTSAHLDIQAFSDADWAGCPLDRRSTGGFCIFLGSSIISWSAKKQPTVARSSTEAEYRFLAHTVAELSWISKLLDDIGYSLPCNPQLWCDNISDISLAKNPIFHARTKHVKINYHYIREKVLANQVDV
ncbi:unnamed protein product [Malus baccata var. baccata]